MKRFGDNWGLNFDLKFRGIPGPSFQKGLRFEKGGDALRDRENDGLEGGYLVKRNWTEDTWELAGREDTGTGTYELNRDFGVWKTNTLKQLFSSQVRDKDVTPMSEVFRTPNIADVENTAGGMITHEIVGTVDDALLVERESKYSDMVLSAGGR